MIDDNFFDVESNPYAACAGCGSTHVNSKDCPGMRIVKKKKKHTPWICSRINMEMIYPVFDLEEEMD